MKVWEPSQADKVRSCLWLPSLCESCFPIGFEGSNLTSAQLYTLSTSARSETSGSGSVKLLVVQTQYPHPKNIRNFKGRELSLVWWACSSTRGWSTVQALLQCVFKPVCFETASEPKFIQWPGHLFQKCIPERNENSNADVQYEIFYQVMNLIKFEG